MSLTCKLSSCPRLECNSAVVQEHAVDCTVFFCGVQSAGRTFPVPEENGDCGLPAGSGEGISGQLCSKEASAPSSGEA